MLPITVRRSLKSATSIIATCSNLNRKDERTHGISTSYNTDRALIFKVSGNAWVIHYLVFKASGNISTNIFYSKAGSPKKKYNTTPRSSRV